MPQIDFGQVFATATEAPELFVHPAQTHVSHISDNTMPERVLQRTPAVKSFSRSSWTNITYVTLTISGGLFCAFYFFNGGDVLRGAAAWPRELLYSRPFASAPANVIAQRHEPAPGSEIRSTSAVEQAPFDRAAEPVQSLDQFPNPTITSPVAVNSDRGTSFSPLPSVPGANPGFPTGSSPNLPSGASGGAGLPGSAGLPGGISPVPPGPGPGPEPDSLLDHLGLSPAVDGLMQTFYEGAADLERVAVSNTHRTVAVAKTAASRSKQRAAAARKTATRKAQNLVRNAAGQQATQTARSTTSSLTRTATSQARSVQNQAGSTVRSTTSSVQSGVGGAVGSVNSGGGAGAGTVTSAVRSGGGIVGGAVGGVTSSLGAGGGLGGAGLGSAIRSGVGSSPVGGLGGGAGGGLGGVGGRH